MLLVWLMLENTLINQIIAFIVYWVMVSLISLSFAAVSHIPHFGDVDVSAGDAVSPTVDLLASPNFGICDTTHLFQNFNICLCLR